MPRIPKVVGRRAPANDGLWTAVMNLRVPAYKKRGEAMAKKGVMPPAFSKYTKGKVAPAGESAASETAMPMKGMPMKGMGMRKGGK